LDYFDYCKIHAVPEWPYPVEYGEEERDSADVLIIGGGLAGCFAAIHAARRGKKVIILEKGATVRSGAAGAGIDHWMFCATNPASPIGPDEMMKIFEGRDPFEARHLLYIVLNEAYESLLDLEEMGVRVRDTNDDFKGAPFRDEKSKLLFAYDYDGRYCIRIFGAKLKPALYRELRRLGVKIRDRTMATMLLTEGGEQSGRVIGATAVNTRTGRFGVYTAKATVLSTAKPLRLWEFGSERVGSYSAHDDPNCAGDGDVMAYRAGAQLVMMERTGPSSGSYRYPAYGTGNASNTWYPANMVDADGKPIPWLDRDGNVAETVEQRGRCAPGQKMFLPHGPQAYEHRGYSWPADLPERIRKGEFKLPFYADLTTMPRDEREAIFGLMIGNEGKTRIPVFKALTQAGFDPEKDMLQANITPPEYAGLNANYWGMNFPGSNSVNVREVAFFNYGGLKVGWDLGTSLPGLYAAGNQAAGVEGASTAAALGRYCGRQVAHFCETACLIQPSEAQILAEKERVYAPLKTPNIFGWKEIQIGLCRIMQEHVGSTKSKEILELGRWWLESVRENELKNVRVENPHDLVRALECEVRLTAGEIIIESSLAREGSSIPLDFHRLDFPEPVPPEQDSYISVNMENGRPKASRVKRGWWLEDSSYREMYEKYSLRDDMEAVK
jgi:succinate dehydrogenase/fumarate reductase flavoprotein subunit